MQDNKRYIYRSMYLSTFHLSVFLYIYLSMDLTTITNEQLQRSVIENIGPPILSSS